MHAENKINKTDKITKRVPKCYKTHAENLINKKERLTTDLTTFEKEQSFTTEQCASDIARRDKRIVTAGSA